MKIFQVLARHVTRIASYIIIESICNCTVIILNDTDTGVAEYTYKYLSPKIKMSMTTVNGQRKFRIRLFSMHIQ